MKISLTEYLRCHNCSGDIEIRNALKSDPDEVLEGSLGCRGCDSGFRVSEGIPILLPPRFSNIAECEIRNKVSEEANRTIDNWPSLYDIHHFRKLARIRIKEELKKIRRQGKPRVLDIGISWGVNYLPFVSDVDLWGLDISFEALTLLRKIYKREGLAIPNLVCASLSSIPIKDIKFDLVWSSLVYLHVPDINEIQTSLNYVINELHNRGGTFIIDNLNYTCERILVQLKNILRPNKKRTSEKEQFRDNFYIKYYLKEDFDVLMYPFGERVDYKIAFTENLFHPEIRIVPRSRIVAQLDSLIQKTPLAKLTARQISLIIKKVG